MNKSRRKILGDAIDRIDTLRDQLDSLRGEIEDIKGVIESEKDAEQEALDNLPDNLRDGEKGQVMEQAVSDLETAINELDDLFGALDGFSIDSVMGNIDDARGAA